MLRSRRYVLKLLHCRVDIEFVDSLVFKFNPIQSNKSGGSDQTLPCVTMLHLTQPRPELADLNYMCLLP